MRLHSWASTSRWASRRVWPSVPNSLTVSLRLCICRIWRSARCPDPYDPYDPYEIKTISLCIRTCCLQAMCLTLNLSMLWHSSREIELKFGYQPSWVMRLCGCSAPHTFCVLYCGFNEYVTAQTCMLYTTISPWSLDVYSMHQVCSKILLKHTETTLKCKDFWKLTASRFGDGIATEEVADPTSWDEDVHQGLALTPHLDDNRLDMLTKRSTTQYNWQLFWLYYLV